MCPVCFGTGCADCDYIGGVRERSITVKHFKELLRSAVCRVAKFLREICCHHNWDCINEDMMVTDSSNVRFKCVHCGKEEGL